MGEVLKIPLDFQNGVKCTFVAVLFARQKLLSFTVLAIWLQVSPQDKSLTFSKSFFFFTFHTEIFFSNLKDSDAIQALSLFKKDEDGCERLKDCQVLKKRREVKQIFRKFTHLIVAGSQPLFTLL